MRDTHTTITVPRYAKRALEADKNENFHEKIPWWVYITEGLGVDVEEYKEESEVTA
ncbi:hypothetical protein [Halomarina pelagica]|uniref:hypothetical protein n=1 Tax=Halomarina pelagica TaxID=2961599 RepID=UPI0020C3996E|nr:hypothetical protein [Halomarina sp. BND7]